LFEAPIAQQYVEPRVELALLVEAVKMPVRVQKRVLSRIRGVGVVAGERPGMRERAALIPLDQVPEGLGITLTAPLDRVDVLHAFLLLLSAGGEEYSEGSKSS
jgi:hypothetical protein